MAAIVRLDPHDPPPNLHIVESGITIDGQGACIQGPGFEGTGISASGAHGVTLRNLRVRGFRLGLHVENAHGWTIEDCDFSGNFHDPGFGWGEQLPGGGMFLAGVSGFAIRRCRANAVWDACHLRESHDSVIESCDFSHTSNTAVKLCASCRNLVQDNNLSYGLRLAPGEVHARDSCGVLIESGSHDNRFLRNDATHGGDGFFIRVLDGRPSTGNLFRENDASFANNNCFEAWAPENIYLANVANHGSYGFWLGNSDRTVLIGNEAAWNGQPSSNHNAPEPGFGHGGIVFVNGSSEHVVAARNYCHHNAGGGIVVRGDVSGAAAFRAFHWLIQQNRLVANRWHVYLQQAEWLDINHNFFGQSQAGNVFDGGGVTGLTVREGSLLAGDPPRVHIEGPRQARAGERLVFAVEGATSQCWDMGDGTRATSGSVEHAYQAPGRYVVGLTAWDGELAALDWLEVEVQPS